MFAHIYKCSLLANKTKAVYEIPDQYQVQKVLDDCHCGRTRRLTIFDHF